MNDGLQAVLRLLERPLFTVGETPVTLISLALAIGLLLFPNSALRRYQQLKDDPTRSSAE